MGNRHICYRFNCLAKLYTLMDEYPRLDAREQENTISIIVQPPGNNQRGQKRPYLPSFRRYDKA